MKVSYLVSTALRDGMPVILSTKNATPPSRLVTVGVWECVDIIGALALSNARLNEGRARNLTTSIMQQLRSRHGSSTLAVAATACWARGVISPG